MGKIILVLIVFMVVMGYMMTQDSAGSGLPFLGFMVGLWLLVWALWALIIGGVLGILKWLLQGAARVTKTEWDK